ISTMLIDFLSNPDLDSYDISSLEIVGGGGAPVPETVGKQLTTLTGLEYVEGYGLSETMSHTHFNPPQRPKLQCFRSEEHTSELQSRFDLVCRLLLEKKKIQYL